MESLVSLVEHKDRDENNEAVFGESEDPSCDPVDPSEVNGFHQPVEQSGEDGE